VSISPPQPTLKVLVFAASLRTESLNRKLADLAARVAAENGATVDVASMRGFDVPSYNGDIELAQGIPPGAKELQRRLTENDAFIISSPEYNASMPGVLKNLIDWTSAASPATFDERHGLSARSRNLASRSPFAPTTACPLQPTALYRLSKLAVWWLRLGIHLERIEPASRNKTAATSRCISR